MVARRLQQGRAGEDERRPAIDRGRRQAHRLDADHRPAVPAEGPAAAALTREASTRWLRVAVIGAAVAALEFLCRAGIVTRLTMIPPSEMAAALYQILADGRFFADMRFTAQNTAAAMALSIVTGFGLGALVHALPRLRRVLEPLFSAYYAVPTFVLYPLMIVAFGIGATSLIVMGAMFGVIAMVVNTLIGLDRV